MWSMGKLTRREECHLAENDADQQDIETVSASPPIHHKQRQPSLQQYRLYKLTQNHARRQVK